MATEARRLPADPGNEIELDELINDGTGDPRTDENPTGSNQPLEYINDRETVGRIELPVSRPTAQNALQSWWSNNISLTITPRPTDPHSHNNDPRDYLALERTHLSHVRTASVLVAVGILIVQLFILRDMNPTAGRVLAALCTGGGIVLVLVGGQRYFRQQKRLSHGIATAGGGGVWIGWVVFMSISVAVFVVVLVED
ncbi:MAG: hypothetical protein LQ343_002820 [Gyalolechia ehrenbergii]|nr:MAG: hypothetical protein LQ343_002820 [Gyalolechia ehrenbergii]